MALTRMGCVISRTSYGSLYLPRMDHVEDRWKMCHNNVSDTDQVWHPVDPRWLWQDKRHCRNYVGLTGLSLTCTSRNLQLPEPVKIAVEKMWQYLPVPLIFLLKHLHTLVNIFGPCQAYGLGKDSACDSPLGVFTIFLNNLGYLKMSCQDVVSHGDVFFITRTSVLLCLFTRF